MPYTNSHLVVKVFLGRRKLCRTIHHLVTILVRNNIMWSSGGLMSYYTLYSLYQHYCTCNSCLRLIYRCQEDLVKLFTKLQ